MSACAQSRVATSIAVPFLGLLINMSKVEIRYQEHRSCMSAVN